MRFRELFEGDGYEHAEVRGPRYRDFHDTSVHNLTHEVLTAAGLRHDEVTLRITGCPNGCGQHYYSHRQVGTAEPHMDHIHSDLKGIGWEHMASKTENYSDSGAHTNTMYQHPNHQRTIVVQQQTGPHDDAGDELTPYSAYSVYFGGLRKRPDAH